ncbi:MAG: hypothetical protein Q7I91_04170, partial [Moraxellaceae bacterium]|nr:hypothetical protein [Moraxellaceae bacterium]
MVAIVAGNGLGLFNTSLNSLGGAGVFGQGTLGQAGGQGYVNASNGNLILQFNDEQLSGRSQNLLHLRTYNAQGALNDADGDGWRWESEKRLSFSGLPGLIGSSVTRTTGDGAQSTFTWSLSGYTSTDGPGAHDSMELKTTLLLLPSEWVWTDGDTRAVERYDTNGRLKSHTNANGETTTYTYDGAGRLTSVKDSSGQELVMVYNAAGKLERLDTRTTSGGPLTRQVYYAYDTSGRLTSVTTDLTPADNSITDGQVYTTSYTYDGSSFRIASISQSDGTSAAYTYQLVAGDYRVASVTDASGTTTFSYDTANRRTDVANGLGQVWSYHYDTAGQLIQVQTPSVTGSGRLSTSYAYDSQGNVTSITDGLGNTITYEYDAQSNRTLERDALGNTVRYVYSSTNQLLNKITYTQPATQSNGSWTNPPDSAAQVTRFAYDSGLNVRFAVDGTGVVTEYRYSSTGLRLAEIRYGDAVYAVSGMSPTATLTESQLNTWAGSRNKTKQQLTEFTYDYRGNVTKSTTYATVNSSGAGILDAQAQVMEYVYSEHGQLLQTIAVRGANRTTKTTLSSMVYDGMGRLMSQVDAKGTQTVTYNGSARQMSVTNSAGLTTTQVFDTQGRLVSINQAATGETTRTTQYVYDAAGRLTLTQDPTGVRNYTFYDQAGRVSARVDGTGAVIEYIYNAAGQLTQQKHYANQVTEATRAAWFNGSTVTPTLVSQIRPATNAADRTISHAYDSAGQRISTTDGVGTVTNYSYDGSHQLVRVQTGIRTTRTFYDAAGRQFGQLDAEGYLRENTYNAAGQLVQVIRYAALTPSAQRANGSLDDLRPTTAGAL